MTTIWRSIKIINIFLDSSMVEHTAVNRGVVGSSPTQGVTIFLEENSWLINCLELILVLDVYRMGCYNIIAVTNTIKYSAT